MSKVFAAVLAVLLMVGKAQAASGVQTVALDHGVEGWYMASSAVPIVDVLLVFDGAGSASDPVGKGGRAAFAAGLLTEGAGSLSAQQFAQALDDRVISLSIDTNADRLTVHVHCLREQAEEAGKLVALALGKPTLAEASQQQIKTQMASLIAQLRENPNYLAQRLLDTRAFRDHAYANPPYGTAESVRGLVAQDARDFMNLYLTRGNVTVSAAGDVDAALLRAMLNPVLEALPASEHGATTVAQTKPQGGGETLTQATQLPQTVIAFVAPGVARTDPHFYPAYLLNHILGGGSLSSRLGKALRQKNGITYSVSTDLDIKRGTALFEGTLATRNASAATAMSDLKAALAEVRDKGVTAEECKDAKSYVIGHFPLQLDRTSAVSGMLSSMQLFGLGQDYLDKRVGYFNAVSCDAINEMARELLAPERFLFAVVGGATTDKPTPEAPAGAPVRSDAR